MRELEKELELGNRVSLPVIYDGINHDILLTKNIKFDIINNNKTRGFTMKSFEMSDKDITKTVSNSQRIEGYKVASKSTQQKAKELMAKYNVKISAWW